jgi:hypothetical protein
MTFREFDYSPDGFAFEIVDDDSGVSYTPYSAVAAGPHAGWAIGFKAEHPDGRIEYILLNPSGGSDQKDDATVFVYMGTTAVCAEDDCQPAHWYQMFEKEDE